MNLAILLVSNYYVALTDVSPNGLPQTRANSENLQKILSIVLSIAGALALLMIVISGLRYILSGGDSQQAAKAREALLYSLIGLAIAITAQVIVSFVVSRL